MKWPKPLLGVLLLLAVALCGLVFLPFTASGSRALVAVLDESTDLELVYSGGSIFGELSLANIRLPTESAIVSLANVQARLESSCLWRGAICLQQLSVGELDVEIPLDNAVQTDTEVETLFWPLPFEVAAQHLVIDTFLVHWAAGELRGRSVVGAVVVEGDQVHVKHAKGSQVLLAVPGSELAQTDTNTVMPEVDLPLDLVVDSLILEDSGWLIDDVRNDYSQLNVSGQWRGVMLSLSSLAVANMQWGEAILQGALRFEHPYRVDVDGRFLAAKPPVWQGLHNASGEFGLTGNLAELQVDLRLCSALGTRISGQWDLVSTGLPMDLQASSGCAGTDGSLMLAQLPGLESLEGLVVDEDWTLSIHGDTRRQQLSVAASLAALQHTGMQLVMRAEHSPGKLQVEEFLVTAERQQSIELSGGILYDEQLSWELAASLENIQLPAQVTPLAGALSGTLDIHGLYSADGWRLLLPRSSLQGQVNNQAALVTGQFQLDQALNTDGTDLAIRLGGDRIRLIDKPGAPAHAQADISDLGYWLGDASGPVQARLDWDRETSTIAIEADSEGLAWGPLRTGLMALSGAVDVGPLFAGKLQLSAVNSLLGEARLDRLQLGIEGSEQNHMLKLQMTGDLASDLQFSASLINGHWNGVLAPTVIEVKADTWELREALPLHYSADVGQVTIPDHCWHASSAQICARKSALGYSGELALELKASLEGVQGLLPERYNARGDVEARIDLRWMEFRAENIAATLHIGSGQLEEALLGEGRARFAWESIHLDYSGDPHAGRLHGEVKRLGKKQLALDVSVPPSLDGSLAGSLVINEIALEDLRPFASRLNRLQGTLDGALQFSGLVRDPRVNGSLELRDGNASIAGNPTEIENVSLSLDFVGNQAEISGEFFLSEGRSDIDGRLVWSPDPALQLSLRGNEKPLLYPTNTIVYAAEDLLLEMDSRGVKLSGDVNVLGGEIVLEDLPAAAVGVSDDVVLLDYTGREAQVVGSSRVELDLKVHVADRLAFSTDGIDSLVGGDLTVLRLDSEPLRLLGKINVKEGHFDLLGPRFNVTRGQLAFVGAPANPELDIAMEREITEDQVTVGIRLLGNLQVPRLEFYSRPSLPEAEVMAYALGGRGLDRAGEGDGLALALAMTSGLMQSNSLLSGLSLGVEGKNIDTRAVIGGYISEKIYLSYGVGLYEPVNTLTVRLDILQNLWAEVVSSLRSSADIYYSWSTR